jgi:hypothetical protein
VAGPKKKSSRYALEERLERVEEMLCVGISTGIIKRKLSRPVDEGGFGVSERQVGNYIQKVSARWIDQAQHDAPFRREKLIRMAERFYARCLTAKAWSPAYQTLNLLFKSSGAFTRHSEARAALLEELGPPPTDPGEALPYTRRILLFELHEVFTNDALDPERRLRWIAELTAKMGMVFSRSEIEESLMRLEALLGQLRGAQGGVKVVDAKAIPRPETARGGRGGRGPRPLPGPVPGAGEGEDPGDDPSGGGPLGPAGA